MLSRRDRRRPLDDGPRSNGSHDQPLKRRDRGEWVDDVDKAVNALPASVPVVTVCIKALHGYRVMFYEHIRRLLADQGVRFRLVHGQGSMDDRDNGGLARLPWSELVRVDSVRIGGRELIWQGGFREARRSDLVVCEQASRLLQNYVLLAAQPFSRFRLAFLGHGKTVRSDTVPTAERAKRWLTRRVHWFFAYNPTGAGYVEDLGFPAERITSLMNTTDTREIREAVERYGPAEVAAVRDELGISGSRVGVYIGGLHGMKRPQFLIDAAEHLRTLVPDFELVVVGQGPEQEAVEDAARRHDWIHFEGPIFDVERVRFGALADVFLLPGAAGLSIVDAFAMRLPVVGVDLSSHPPEFEYLVDDVNGIVLAANSSPRHFAEETARLLGDADKLARLRAGADTSAHELTIEAMAQRFVDGALTALGSNPSHKP